MTSAREGGAVDSGLIASLATLPAGSRQRWWTCGAIVSLFVVFCLVAPFAKVQLPQAIGFIPAVQGTIFVTDLATAVWLFAQVSLVRSRALLALANAYLFTALIVVAHTLTFPGAFAPGGLLGAGTQTTGWLYIIWHFCLPVAVLVYASLKRAPGTRRRILASPRFAIFWSAIAVIASVCGIVWGLTIGDEFIPPLFLDRITYSPLVLYLAGLSAVVCGIALLCLVSGKPSVLDELVAISVAATMAEVVMTIFTGGRYDVGWYASDTFGLLASNAVFLALFTEFTRLYSRNSIALAERKRVDEALRESEERVRLALEAGEMAMFDSDLRTGAMVWNDECYRLLGYRVGEVVPSRAAWMALVHPDDRAAAAATLAAAMAQHKDYVIELRIVRRDSSTRWVRTRGRFFFDAAGPRRVIGIIDDETEARQHIETQRILVAELQHRTRNLMAVVQSIAHQTLDTVDSLVEFEGRFNRRLEALSRAQSLLSRADEVPITLEALVAMEFDALGLDASGGKIAFGGPEVQLRKSTVEMLALAIHELLTNAIKYGALASQAGHLSVNWRIEGPSRAQQLTFDWVEHAIALTTNGGTPRRGYGRTLIEEALPYSLGAETRFDLRADTLHCRISLPLTNDSTGEISA